jgi:hypothetical protein
VTENSVSNVKKINHGLPLCQNNMNGENWILKRKKFASNELTYLDITKTNKNKIEIFDNYLDLFQVFFFTK